MPKSPEQYQPSPEEIKKEMEIQKEIEEDEKPGVTLKEGLRGDSARKELEKKAEEKMEVIDGYIYKIGDSWYKYSKHNHQVAKYGAVGGPISGTAGWIYRHKEIKSRRERMGAVEMEHLLDEEKKIMFPEETISPDRVIRGKDGSITILGSEMRKKRE